MPLTRLTAFELENEDGFSVIFEVLNELSTPFMTITESCGQCGEVISEHRYDASNPTDKDMAFGNGTESRARMEAHWRTHERPA